MDNMIGTVIHHKCEHDGIGVLRVLMYPSMKVEFRCIDCEAQKRRVQRITDGGVVWEVEVKPRRRFISIRNGVMRA